MYTRGGQNTARASHWGRSSKLSVKNKIQIVSMDMGIESRWRRDFPHPSRPALGPTQPFYIMETESLPGVKRPGRGVDHPPPYSTNKASACNTDTAPTQPHRNSNTHRSKNKTTNVVSQHNSRKLLMMDILMSETC